MTILVSSPLPSYEFNMVQKFTVKRKERTAASAWILEISIMIMILGSIISLVTIIEGTFIVEGKNRQIISQRYSSMMITQNGTKRRASVGGGLRATSLNNRDLSVMIDLSNLKKHEQEEKDNKENKASDVVDSSPARAVDGENSGKNSVSKTNSNIHASDENKETNTESKEEAVTASQEEAVIFIEEAFHKEEEKEKKVLVVEEDGTTSISTVAVTEGSNKKYCGLQKLDGTIECSVHPKLIQCESYEHCNILEEDGEYFYKECLEECNTNDILPSHAEKAQRAFNQRQEEAAAATKEQEEVEETDEETLEAALEQIANQEHVEEHSIFDEQESSLLQKDDELNTISFGEKYCGARDTDGGDFECDPQATLCRTDSDCEYNNDKFTKCLAPCKGILEGQSSNLSVTAVTNTGTTEEISAEVLKEEKEITIQETIVNDLVKEQGINTQDEDPLDENIQQVNDHSTGYCGRSTKNAESGTGTGSSSSSTECNNEVISCETDDDCTASSSASQGYTKCLSECKMILFEGLTFDEHQQLMDEQIMTGGHIHIPTDPLVEYFEPGSEINQQILQDQASAAAGANGDNTPLSETYVFDIVQKYCGIQGNTPLDFHCQTGPFKPCQSNDDCRSSNKTNQGEEEGGQLFEDNFYTDCLIECGEVAAMEDPTSAMLYMSSSNANPATVDTPTQDGEQ